jgi:Protein of unknown function (DUF4236)
MGWRFRRSFKIAPGIRWNLSTRGSSWSIGRRGFTLNVSPRGVRRTVSIPRTGLSHTAELKSKPSARISQFDQTPHTAASHLSEAPYRAPELRADLSTIAPLDNAAAVIVAGQWAQRRAPLLGRLLVGAVTGVERRPVERYRAMYTIRTRRIAVRATPLERKIKPSGTVPNPSAFDPWSPDIEARLAATRVIAICPMCRGEGRQPCFACGGLVEIPCDVCTATGTVVSDRSGKMIKCRSCGGDGRRRCPCRDGVVTCASCNGKTVATVWLELEETERIERRIDGDVRFASAIDAEEISANVERIGHDQGSREELGSPALTLLDRPALKICLDHDADREQQVDVAHEQSTVATVYYSLAGKSGSVAVRGWNGSIEADDTSMSPFVALRHRLWLGMVLTFVCSGLLATGFVSRHWYFGTTPAAALLFALTFASPLALWPWLVYRSRPVQNRRTMISVLSAVPALLVFFGQVILSATSPSLARAQHLAASGHVRHAMLEARASAELGVDPDNARRLHDALQLKLLIESDDPAPMFRQLGGATFLTDDGKRTAEGRALAVVARHADALLAAGEFQKGLALLQSVPPSLQSYPVVLERVSAAQGQAVNKRWAVIHSSAPLSSRVQACEAIKQPVTQLGVALTDYAETSVAAIEKACASVTAEEQRHVHDAELAARRAQLNEERKARAAEAQAQRAMKAWSSAPLLCNDGSLSPSLCMRRVA